MSEYTPYQQKIIKRYYEHQPEILHQRLAEMVGDLYLAEGKKRQKLWLDAAEAMQKLAVPEKRIAHIVLKDDPAILAILVKELEGKK